MPHLIYISEPDVINVESVRQLLPSDGYELVAGHNSFTADFTSPADVLLLRSGTTVRDDIKQYFPQLYAVIRVGTGLDNVDLAYCRQAGIAVYHAPGANADAVAEYVTSMILYVYRRLYMLNPDDVIGWNRVKFMGESVAGKTVGIVGFGNIGRLLQKKLTGMGCTDYVVYDPFLDEATVQASGAQLVTLPELLERSDIVSLHVPLTADTKYLINAESFKLLKEGALLVNSARGGIVDEQALLQAMEHKELYYVADTVEGEPHVNPDLLRHPHVTVTPHIASLTTASDQAMLQKALENYLAGITAR